MFDLVDDKNWLWEARELIGPPAIERATAILNREWLATRDGPRDKRASLFVAMRRVGIVVPTLSDDKHGDISFLLKRWADMSPDSPRRVCAVSEEQQARREEDDQGRRRSSLE